MTTNFGAFPPFSLPTSRADHRPLCAVRSGFLTHKYLLVALLQCLQEQHRRAAPPQRERMSTAAHLCRREPSAEQEVTPCIVLREHVGQGGLSVSRLPVECLDLQQQPLASWMRGRLLTHGRPDRDTLHFAMAPTLPGVPMLVHSIGAEGVSYTHMFSGGTWSLGVSDAFLLRAIRYAQLVATVIPITGLRAMECAVPSAQTLAAEVDSTTEANAADRTEQPCALSALGQRYDHIAVHAALNELKAYSREMRSARAAPSHQRMTSGRQGG